MTLKSKAFNSNDRFVVALDGPAASGKGIIGKLCAQKLGLTYFQSSIVYRSLAISCINQSIDLNNIDKVIQLSKSIQNFGKLTFGNEHFSNENIGSVASKIAVIPEVRTNLGKYLIELIQTTPRIIMEGRDIGTVIAPSADLKIFINASPEVRASRRYKELQQQGGEYIFNEILEELKARDKRDIERKVAPLIVTTGALEIDTSYLTPEEVLDKIIEFISVR